jgi:hypothetical protein
VTSTEDRENVPIEQYPVTGNRRQGYRKDELLKLVESLA